MLVYEEDEVVAVDVVLVFELLFDYAFLYLSILQKNILEIFVFDAANGAVGEALDCEVGL